MMLGGVTGKLAGVSSHHSGSTLTQTSPTQCTHHEWHAVVCKQTPQHTWAREGVLTV